MDGLNVTFPAVGAADMMAIVDLKQQVAKWDKIAGNGQRQADEEGSDNCGKDRNDIFRGYSRADGGGRLAKVRLTSSGSGKSFPPSYCGRHEESHFGICRRRSMDFSYGDWKERIANKVP